jgi:hypothetical protein
MTPNTKRKVKGFKASDSLCTFRQNEKYHEDDAGVSEKWAGCVGIAEPHKRN